MTTMKPKASSVFSLLDNPIMLVLLPLATLAFLVGGFLFLRNPEPLPSIPDANFAQLIVTIFAIIWGVGAVVALFFTGNYLVEHLPEKWKDRLLPFIFVGPALALLTWYLALPALRTFISSLQNANLTEFVWFNNYVRIFTERDTQLALGNNLLWMVVGTILVVGLALLIAILADRSSFENIAKSAIFMPMAISMVGAGVIWKFIYDINPEIGMLNAFRVNGGAEPQPWLVQTGINNLLLIIVMVWLQTGYAMVLISAAIKGVPDDLLEAARVDGASEVKIFTSIIVPSIAGTLVTVITTVIIFTLKIFDIVMIMTGGNFDTEVIGVRFYKETFNTLDKGMGSAIAIVLLIAVIPVMVYNLRQFNKRDTF